MDFLQKIFTLFLHMEQILTNNRIHKFIIATLLFALHIPSYPQDSCKKYETPGATDPLLATGCAEEKRKAADVRLNVSYKKLVAQLKNDTEKENFSKSQIIEAQRAWIVFRDAECALQQSLNTGTRAWKAVYGIECKREMTEMRTQTLDQYFKEIQE